MKLNLERNEFMKTLEEKELKQIVGGFSFGLGAVIGAGITFLIGLIDGFVRPLGCNK